MKPLDERLDGIHIRVRVPGAEIYGELRDRRCVDVTFGPDTYGWSSETYLEQAVATLGRLLTARWTEAYHAALRDSGLAVTPLPGSRSTDYERARERIEATGASADGRVVISAVGLRNFAVRIRPGTVRELPEQDFAERVRDAAAVFLTDHMNQVRELQRTHLG